MAKFGMSLVVLGLAGEQRGKIAVNALWPRTTIATAAIKNLLGGDAIMRMSRTPEILAEAAYRIFQKPKSFTGNFLIDDTFLAGEGVTDFDQYRVDPSQPLQVDFFVPDDMPPPAGRKFESEGLTGLASALRRVRTASMSTLLLSAIPPASIISRRPAIPSGRTVCAPSRRRWQDERFQMLAREQAPMADARHHRARAIRWNTSRRSATPRRRKAKAWCGSTPTPRCRPAASRRRCAAPAAPCWRSTRS